jgi:Flp pilus assembly protein TadD
MSPPSIQECNNALEAGAADEALALAIDLLHRNKKDIDALTVCYKAYRLKSDIPNAIKVLDVLLTIDPQPGWVAAELGILHFRNGNLVRAESVLRKAIEFQPCNATAHAYIGTVFSELNRLAAGEWHFRRALELAGPDCETLTGLALNLTRQQKAAAADELYAKALALEPHNVRTMAYWAKLHEVRGEFEQARQLLDLALTIQPGSVDLLTATLQARTGDNEGALATIGASARPNGDAVLERGLIRDRIGDYDGAWTDFVEAKRLLATEAGGLRYDAAAVEAFFAELRQAFGANAMRDLPRAALRRDTAQPLFIVGAPRSGTTLVERILAAHPSIAAGGELPFIQDLRVFSERLLPGANFPKNFACLQVADQRHVTTMMRDFYFAQREEMLQPTSGTTFVTDKMPFNEMYLPLIRLAFPDAPIVHVTRHRLDVAVSMLSNKLNHGFYCAYRIEDILHHLDAVADLHDYYRKQFSSREFDLQYETLASRPESTVRSLLAYLGLSYDPQCLSFHRESHFVATPSYRQVNEEINEHSVARYRNYQRQLDAFVDRD